MSVCWYNKFERGKTVYPNPLIERVHTTPDGPVGCQVYFDGEKWVHRHVHMDLEKYEEELKYKEYRDIKGTKVTRVKLQLTEWNCTREQKYRLISKAVERLAQSPVKPLVYLSIEEYFKECLHKPV